MEESYIEWLVKRKDPIYHDSSRYRYLFYFPEFKCGI